MEEGKSVLSAFFANTVVGAKDVDPRDARTWWANYRQSAKGYMEIQAQMHDHTMHLTGVSARKFYYDPRVAAMAFAAVSAYYQLDALNVATDIYNYEAEAMGARMIYSDTAMPTIDFREPLVSKPADLDKLKPPANWLSAGRVRYCWEAGRLTREVTGGLGLNFCAPFSLAIGVRSYPLLIRDMKRNPAFAHDLFARLVDDVLPSYLKAQADYLGGVDMAVGADAWAAYPNLTPELIEEWVVPYGGRLLQNCMTKYGFAAFPAASGDYCEEDMGKFDKKILWECFDAQVKVMMGQPAIFMAMGRTQDYPLDATREWLNQWKAKGVRASVTYAVNARFLRDGTPAEIAECVKNFIKTFAYDHNLTLFLANIPADAPTDNVHAAVSAAHCYGKLPLAPDLDAVQFELPKRESFQEYVAKMSDGLGLQF
jgi:uroporphyrinogen-III decarboxylase